MEPPIIVDKDKVQSKIKGRETAQDCMKLLKECSEELNAVAKEEFWKTMSKDSLLQGFMDAYGPEKAVPIVESKVKVFNEIDAIWFENQEIPYGKYEGRKVGVIYEENQPYLHALAIKEEDAFKPMLNQYLLYMQRRKVYTVKSAPEQVNTSCRNSSTIQKPT